MSRATFDQRVAAYGAAERLQDAIASAEEAMPGAEKCPVAKDRLERARAMMGEARRELLSLAATGDAQ